MSSRPVKRAIATALIAGAALLASCTSSDDAAPETENGEASVDVYSFAGGCWSVAAADGTFVRRSDAGWSAGASEAEAAPFHLQATALGSYLLYGPDGEMVAAGDDGITAVTEPGPAADWTVEADGAAVRLTNIDSGDGLGTDGDGALVAADGDAASWTLSSAEGCAAFPDIDPGVEGEPFVGESPDAPVRGFLDAHTHVTAFQFLGGKFHCGRPWSRYGVTVALRDCADHENGGTGAVVDGLLSGGALDGSHDASGWPEFTGWPNVDSLTHEGTYWRWIERSWRGGLRLMVSHLVDNRALCEIYPENDGTECNDMASIRDQAADLRALEAYIDAQSRGPGKGFFRIVESPEEAREVINDGKLAVVMGVEASEILDCGAGDGPTCDEASIDAGLDELQELGVRSVFPVHKFDNGLGGAKYDGGLTGVFVNVGNRYATGEYWTPETCAPGQDADNTVISPGTVVEANADLVIDTLGEKVRPLVEDDLPDYPAEPHCNPKGLTDLGRYAIEGLIERGMIVETDHLSAKARDEAFDVLEEAGYPGVISSHSWDDATSRQRLVDLGGLAAGYAGSGFADEWEATREMDADGDLPGFGFASDTNGLAPQPDPREGNEENPVTYPFTSFDGGSTIEQQRSGERTYDVNEDGAAHYGLFVDWIEDLRITAGDELIDDLADGAEAYLQMWAAAEAH